MVLADEKVYNQVLDYRPFTEYLTGISTGSRFRGFLVDPIEEKGPWLSLDMAPAF